MGAQQRPQHQYIQPDGIHARILVYQPLIVVWHRGRAPRDDRHIQGQRYRIYRRRGDKPPRGPLQLDRLPLRDLGWQDLAHRPRGHMLDRRGAQCLGTSQAHRRPRHGRRLRRRPRPRPHQRQRAGQLQKLPALPPREVRLRRRAPRYGKRLRRPLHQDIQ